MGFFSRWFGRADHEAGDVTPDYGRKLGLFVAQAYQILDCDGCFHSGALTPDSKQKLRDLGLRVQLTKNEFKRARIALPKYINQVMVSHGGGKVTEAMVATKFGKIFTDLTKL